MHRRDKWFRIVFFFNPILHFDRHTGKDDVALVK